LIGFIGAELAADFFAGTATFLVAVLAVDFFAVAMIDDVCSLILPR
jgi:hypothetical protein